MEKDTRPLMIIDFETQSEVNLKTAGSYRYVEGTYFAPSCMCYSLDQSPEIHTWTRWDNTPFPVKLMQSSQLAAFNVEFEYNVLKSKWFKWHDIDMDWLTVDHFIDVQAVARIFGLPFKLDKLAKALNLAHLKDSKGTRLITQLCVIKKGRVPTPNTHPRQFEDLFAYCRQDVRATRDTLDMLIKKDLSSYERKVFNHMMEQNQYGYPIDIRSVHKIKTVLENYKDICNSKIYTLTNGAIEKGTQTVAIAQYIRDQGFRSVTSIAAPVVAEILENKQLDKHCRDLLRLRQRMSHSSTAKFGRMIDMVSDDNRIQGNLKYYGGHTGRFAGTGVQLHNLPRAQFDDPEEVLNDFMTKRITDLMKKYGNLGETATKLIRPTVMAPEGKLLCVADYVSVENVLLHWAANDVETTNDFHNGIDQYKKYASRRFNVHYSEVTKRQRTYAKPCVLGLGYGGGGAALQRVAKGYGVNLSEAASENDKVFYRGLYPMIPDLWYKVSGSMVRAVEEETIVQLDTGTVSLQFIKRGTYAFIILPSGRFLCYPAPTVQRDAQYGNKCMTYMGEDSSKQWRRLGDQERLIKSIPMPDMPIHGGRLVENIIQALARDLLVFGMLEAKRQGFKLIGSVHDEAIAEVDESVTSNTLDFFCEALCQTEDWAHTVPLRADGYLGKRYRKG